MERYTVISDGTPEGDNAAKIAKALLDSIPEEDHEAITRAAAKWATHPLLYGTRHPLTLEAYLTPLIKQQLERRASMS